LFSVAFHHAEADGEVDDKDSLKRLNDVTVENVQNETLRFLYVAAQTADIDLKINCAIIETMKIYRRILGTGAALGYIPTSAPIHLTASTISLCKAILPCFGLPRVSYREVYGIVKCNLWDDLRHASVVTPNGFSAVSLTLTEILGAALTGGALNIPLVVTVTTRLVLILASDLILVLVRACKETTFTSASHPQLKDVENAARYYRPSSSEVHEEILRLVPKWDLKETYRYDKVRLGLEEILHRWNAVITKNFNSSRLDLPRGKSFGSDRTLLEEEVEIDKMNEIVKTTKLNEMSSLEK
jgi:hypothetical protein